MTSSRPVLAGLVLSFALCSFAYAQTPPPQQPPPQKPADPAQKPQDPNFKENVVVSASKLEQQLVDAPATMTVIGPRELALAPSNNYADILRAVPGLNITQIAARDVNVNARSATSSLATAQLSVVDGRSIYQDFFGFTMWEFMPSNLDEIKRIEVIRGPASAVWGANAMNGVVNVLTKSPREMLGTTVTFGVGAMDREVNKNKADAASMFYVRGTHAQAVNDRWAYKLSIGTSVTDAFARPTGLIPNGGTTSYPNYKNEGSQQPKIDATVDYDFVDPGKKLQFAAGLAGTDGMMHTGIGPFKIHSGAKMGYWRTAYTKNALKVQAFMNTLDGSATNVVVTDPLGKAVGLDFDTKTFDVEVGDSRIFGTKNVLTYGGNLRINRFHLTIAPGEDSRNEGGFYVQDEFLATSKVRLVLGARVDKFSSIDNAVFSPRLAVVFKPVAEQSVRVSYNRAFRAPSMINNHLDTVVAAPLPFGAIDPAFAALGTFLVPATAVGNKELTEESIDAFEVAYTGHLNQKVTVSAALFYTKYKDGIYFTTTETWQTPPPGFPPQLGPFTGAQIWNLLLSRGIVFPKNFTYKNLGEVKNKGFEFGVDGALTENTSGFFTYAYQSDPIPSFPNLTAEQALAEINLPSKHMWTVGLSGRTDRAYGTVSVSRQSRAFWQDVLDARYSGYTQANTSLNVTLGTTWQAGRYGAAFKATNLMNQTIQQHIFGDILKRSVVFEFKMRLQ